MVNRESPTNEKRLKSKRTSIACGIVLGDSNGWTYVLCFGVGAIAVALIIIAVSMTNKPTYGIPNYVSIPNSNYVVKN